MCVYNIKFSLWTCKNDVYDFNSFTSSKIRVYLFVHLPNQLRMPRRRSGQCYLTKLYYYY